MDELFDYSTFDEFTGEELEFDHIQFHRSKIALAQGVHKVGVKDTYGDE